MQKIQIHIQAMLVFIVHFLVYRASIFIGTNKVFSDYILFRKFITGFLYDLHFLFLLGLVILLLTYKLSRRSFSKIIWIMLFFPLAFLNLVNFYMLGYFSDGLASFNILFEYLRDIDTVLKMGVGTFNPLPPILLFIPGLLLFINFKKIPNVSFKKLFLFLIFISIGLNQIVKITRVNRNSALESNTLLKMIKSQENTNKIFAEVKKLSSTKLTDSDLKLIQIDPDATYISKEYPLMKHSNVSKASISFERPNIVIIMLESVASFQTGIKKYFSTEDYQAVKSQKSSTPFIDSLLDRSIVVPNFYGHGTFTSLGQVSTWCSIYDPISAIDGKGSIMRTHYGTNLKCLPKYLKEQGYTNLFFNGYRKGFDNKEMFLPKVGFDDSFFREKMKKDMSIKKDEHTWGLTDKTVLDYMSKKLKSIKSPFFAHFMSVNTHAPYDHIKKLPKGYTKHEYSLKKVDNAIKDFIDRSRDEQWFKNSIFVFTSDNGAPLKLLNNSKNINEDKFYNRIPMIIYSPNFENQAVIKKVSSQIDIAPSLLNIMGINSFKSHFVGHSIFTQKQSMPIQYKHYNNYFMYPNNNAEVVNKVMKINMGLIFKNKVEQR